MKLAHDFTFTFPIHDSHGAVAPDALPTALIYEDHGGALVYAPTVAQIGALTGQYYCYGAATAANGFEAGRDYNIVVTALIAGATWNSRIAQFSVEANDIDDLDTVVDAIQAQTDLLHFTGDDVQATLDGEEVSADVVKVSGDATAANNLELQFDGTGLTGETFPATQKQGTDIDTEVDKIGIPVIIDGSAPTLAGMLIKFADDTGGASFDATTDSLHSFQSAVSPGVPAWVTASADTETTGVTVSGSYLDTFLDNGTYWVTRPVAGGFNVYLTYPLAMRLPNSIKIVGFWNSGGGRTCDIYAYNFTTALWDKLSDTTTRFSSGVADVIKEFILLLDHKDPVSKNCLIGFQSTSTNVNDRLNIDQCLVSAVQSSASAAQIADAVYDKMKYTVYNGEIHYDNNAGYPGTDVGVNGLDDYPSDNWADTKALATLVGVNRYHLKVGSALTLDDAQTKKVFMGKGTITMNGQDVSGSAFEDCNILGDCGHYVAHFSECELDTVTNFSGSIHDGRLRGSIGLGNGASNFITCSSHGPAPAEAPEFTFIAGTTYIAVRMYSGKLTIKSMVAGQILSFDCPAGDLVIDASCSGGEVRRRGVHTLTDNSGGAVTITMGALDHVEIESITDTALEDYGLDHLFAAAVAGADVADDSFAAQLVSKRAVADFDDYNHQIMSLETISDNLGNIEADTDRVDGLIEDDGLGNDRFTAKALEEAPSSGGSAFLDEDTTLHTVLGTFGFALGGLFGTPVVVTTKTAQYRLAITLDKRITELINDAPGTGDVYTFIYLDKDGYNYQPAIILDDITTGTVYVQGENRLKSPYTLIFTIHNAGNTDSWSRTLAQITVT